jgi:antitoxin MazE
MKTLLRPIGNSRGIILPAALLATIAFEDEVEMTVQDNRIILEPVKKSKPLRQGWYAQALAESAPDAILSEAQTSDWDAVSEPNEEWTW